MGDRGTPPRHSGACCTEAACQQAEECGVGTGRCEVDADAGGLLDDAGADLEQSQPKGCELCSGERRGAGNGVAQREHEPIGCGVEEQPELVGEGALAGGEVRGELALAHLDQVLGLAAGTVDVFVEMARLSDHLGPVVHGEPDRAEFEWTDFDHVAESRDHVENVLRGALRAGETGVNIFLHGPPGTGKTELCQTMAARLDVPLFSIGERDKRGGEPNRLEQLGDLSLA